MLALYTDRTSVSPGESFAIHASSDAGPCTLEIARVGADRQVVMQQEGVRIGKHPVPADADSKGCGWPVALAVQAGADWRSGYYDIVLTD
ncbi:MAG TPA: hypothetical protein VGU69_08620, partial [Rhizomicrobium sp.]|nr:hypothetical protein [Rhizomicrobium sp.]